ncbi:hypothetical protein C0J52_13913 [Blattella germanica]|nr:hypothetical protein C0J52_13913 [Blattella germanica]
MFLFDRRQCSCILAVVKVSGHLNFTLVCTLRLKMARRSLTDAELEDMLAESVDTLESSLSSEFEDIESSHSDYVPTQLDLDSDSNTFEDEIRAKFLKETPNEPSNTEAIGLVVYMYALSSCLLQQHSHNKKYRRYSWIAPCSIS